MNKPADRPRLSPRAAFVTDDPAEALAHFSPIAAEIAEPSPINGDLGVARHNLDRSLATLEPVRDAVASTPGVDLADFDELPTLWLATRAAADAVPLTVSDGEVRAVDREVTPMRGAALSYLDAAAFVGLVPAGEVRAIRKGSGMVDRANDCVAIASMFQRHATTLDGRHPFTPDFLDGLREKGLWLLRNVTPERAIRSPMERSPRALERDRLAALLATRYERLRAALGLHLGLRDLDSKAPKLFSRKRSRRAIAAAKPTQKPAEG